MKKPQSDKSQAAWPQGGRVDALAGLPDRGACVRAVAEQAGPGRRPLAVLWLNIDRFKQINDSFGHLAGDGLLAEIVHRLERAGTRGRLARMGADEFVLLVPDCGPGRAEALARDLLDAIGQPLEIGSLRLRPSASIGIALSSPAEGPHALLERADRAMLDAKHLGGGQCVFAGEVLPSGRSGKHLAREELAVEEVLHRALETGGLSLDYQPILRVADAGLEGVEALMRCRVDGALVPPARFIPVAEKTGLIVRLGEWSLLTATRFASRLIAQGRPVRVAVNVSRAQLTAPKFSQALHAALACSDAPAGAIELEITESLFMDRSEVVQHNLHAALEAGFSLAIDDFGTGYSCLAVLKDLPAGKLKLDRAFVSGLPEDRRSYSVARAVVRLALDLGMSVVAEGVETAAQHEALCEAGVTAIQGFHLARPMAEAALEAWLIARSAP